jgi:hypothetical protein
MVGGIDGWTAIHGRNVVCSMTKIDERNRVESIGEQEGLVAIASGAWSRERFYQGQQNEMAKVS